MANQIAASNSPNRPNIEATPPPAVPRPVLVAVAVALAVAVFLQMRRSGPPVQRSQDVAAWLSDPQQVAQWQAQLKEAGVDQLLIEYDPGQVLERVGLDTNSDERADLVGIYRAGRLVRMARDDNRDNRVDQWVLLKPDKEERTRLESDRNFDGLVDTWTVIQAGVVQSVESDTNGDGKVDRWEIYSDGKLKEIASDNDGNGRAEQWEHYSSSGELTLIEYDLDGDGKPDRSFAPSGAR